MKALLATAICLAGLAYGQSNYVPGHTTKGGKWVEGHWQKPRKSKDQVQSEQTAKGKHRERRYYPGHFDKNGHFVKPRWGWVWVKD